METVNNSPQKTSKQSKPTSKTIPGILLRLILVLVAGCLVGAVIYFAASGWVPYLDQRVFQPIDTNQAIVQELQSTQKALEIEISSLQATVDENQSGTRPDIETTLDQLSEDVIQMQLDVDNNTYYSGTLAPALIATVSAQTGLKFKKPQRFSYRPDERLWQPSGTRTLTDPGTADLGSPIYTA